METSYPRSAKTARGASTMRRTFSRASARRDSAFPAEFRGTVLRPADDGFDEARVVCNGRSSDGRPALIARCLDADDVVTVMRHASARDLPVAVRGGGHGAAMPDGALVVDLSGMREVSVAPVARTVRVQAGVRLGELDAPTQEHGPAVPAGTAATTGVARLTPGGGIGHLMRSSGATVDNLIGCDVVTVDGRRVRADAETNADLFWALRGGGGNFGVVTAFEYRAHPVGPVRRTDSSRSSPRWARPWSTRSGVRRGWRRTACSTRSSRTACAPPSSAATSPS
ncbi:FAD-binding oxidoreductase [Streptomyces roseirectus]|uniref:FAD-binding oxidoreductase n=1 Tax=Streptomyces roseirectus TaxID=2768066 RepID=UPI001FEC2D01|nr:FAD-binding oxidoreductase [Streptomyces roseirectus]